MGTASRRVNVGRAEEEMRGGLRISSEEAVRMATREMRRFTTRALSDVAGMPERTVRRYLRRMLESGEVEVVSRVPCGRRGSERVFRRAAVAAEAAEARRPRPMTVHALGLREAPAAAAAFALTPWGGEVVREELYQALWRIIRRERQFRIVELLGLVDEAVASAPGAVHVYIHHLHRAGYLKVLDSGRDMASRLWQLQRDTGPAAPRVVVSTVVEDPNDRSRSRTQMAVLADRLVARATP